MRRVKASYYPGGWGGNRFSPDPHPYPVDDDYWPNGGGDSNFGPIKPY